MDNSVKIGCILQSCADAPMKYKVFSSKSIEVLKEEELLGEANSYQGACRIINQHCEGADTNPYWRFLMSETATFVDYGSWSEFAAIVPPVSFKELNDDEETSD